MINTTYEFMRGPAILFPTASHWQVVLASLRVCGRQICWDREGSYISLHVQDCLATLDDSG